MTDLVAGTRLWTASDDDRVRTILLSDLHVPHEGGEVMEWFASLLARARADRGAAARTRILILGDLFDSYVGPKQLGVGAYATVADLLACACGDGIAITVLHGNRDFMLDETFTARTGCRVVGGGLRCRIANRAAIALHGDELLLLDHAHQRSRPWRRNKLLRAILKWLPLWVALRIAAGVRRRSMGGLQRDQRPERPDSFRFEPIAEAVAEVYAAGAELLVFGHIHRPARGTLGPGREYCVLPAFDQAGVHLVAQGNELHFCGADGRRRPDFGPREFRSLSSAPQAGASGRLLSEGEAR